MSVPLALVVSCEHGGNRVPRAYRELFRGKESLLSTHRAYDPGALATARLLARRFDAPLVTALVTRLLVELNRSPSHPRLFSEITRGLSPSERERIKDRYYTPHREEVERTIRDLVRGGRKVLHVASHSFTPELNGEPRLADVAWLYDPRQRGERDVSTAWRDALARRRPDLRLRRNYPYRGVDDGLTRHLRRVFPEHRYAGVELEVSQSWYLGGALERRRIRQDVADSLADVLGGMGSKR